MTFHHISPQAGYLDADLSLSPYWLATGLVASHSQRSSYMPQPSSVRLNDHHDCGALKRFPFIRQTSGIWRGYCRGICMANITNTVLFIINLLVSFMFSQAYPHLRHRIRQRVFLRCNSHDSRQHTASRTTIFFRGYWLNCFTLYNAWFGGCRLFGLGGNMICGYIDTG